MPIDMTAPDHMRDDGKGTLHEPGHPHMKPRNRVRFRSPLIESRSKEKINAPRDTVNKSQSRRTFTLLHVGMSDEGSF
jgi:hypothetical protein